MMALTISNTTLLEKQSQKVFLVQKALARVLNFSALNSLKLESNVGMGCPKMTVERPARPIARAGKESRAL